MFVAAFVVGLAWAVMRAEAHLVIESVKRVTRVVWEGRYVTLAYLPAFLLFGRVAAALQWVDRNAARVCISTACLLIPVYLAAYVRGIAEHQHPFFFATSVYIGVWLCCVMPRLVVPIFRPGRFEFPKSNLSP